MSATRILTVADVHQHRALLAELAGAVERVRPAAVAFVGDLLDSNGSAPGMAGLEECAEQLANLATPELIFVRGNHEEDSLGPDRRSCPVTRWQRHGSARRFSLLPPGC
jgi:metallophosphoesterase superfamily enzyme